MEKRNWDGILEVLDEDKLMLKKSEIPVINSSEVKRSNDEVNIQKHYDKCLKVITELDVRGKKYASFGNMNVLKNCKKILIDL